MQISSNSPKPLQRSRRSSGFTLVEIVVVLAIGAIVSAVTLGGFKELSEGNKSTNCQANLAQIYQAIRLYSADESGKYPLYNYQNPGAPSGTPPEKRIGLWSLWTFPRGDSDADGDGSLDRNQLPKVGEKPIDRYIRNVKVFHCPADDADGRTNLFQDDSKQQYNINYLSYQVDSVADPLPAATFADAVPNAETETYLPSRTVDKTDPLWRRQLDPAAVNSASRLEHWKRPPVESTIITWCRWHRYSRDRDNVLFGDGSVQSIPRVQDNYVDSNCTPATTPLQPTLESWKRTPKFPQCTY